MTWRIGSSPPIRQVIARGFTLIEVVLVSIVLVILLAASLPAFLSTSQRLRAEHAAFEFAQLLRYAHARAVSDDAVAVWTWDGQLRRAQVRVVPQTDGQPAECSAINPAAAPVAQSAPLPEELAVRIQLNDQPAACAGFFPDGTGDPVTVHLIQGARDYAITVHGATSQVVLAAGAAAR